MNLDRKLLRFLPAHKKSPQRATRSGRELDLFLKGKELDTPFGTCYLVEKHFSLQEMHGSWPLKNTLKVTASGLQQLGEPLENNFRIEKALFLDTETTGLAGGSGTYAFLIGLGRFSPTHFIVKQLLMRDFNEELALLHLLNQELKNVESIISFNGKTFDLPLLQTRFTISRFDQELIRKKVHLDLLQLARRLWRYKLTSCSLNSLESQILGVQRTGDIPGYEIPQRYFQFLNSGRGQLLEDIARHNLFDIISMVTLLYRIYATLPPDPKECLCPFEAEALAQLAVKKNHPQLALDFFNSALLNCQDPEQQRRLLWKLSFIFKRLGQYRQASQFWQQILELNNGELRAYEELAKCYEHRFKDLQKAEEITRRALALAQKGRSPQTPAWEHRLGRILRKMKTLRSKTYCPSPAKQN